MTDQSTIGPAHLYRAAFVYVRQSSLAQVENNTESTRSQFALEVKALRLGWLRAAVSVVDDDLTGCGNSTRQNAVDTIRSRHRFAWRPA